LFFAHNLRQKWIDLGQTMIEIISPFYT